MVRKFLAATAVAALIVVPSIASAEDPAAGAAAGAAVGGVTGAIVGGPIGAAVGAGVGGTVGAGAAQERNRDREVVIEHERRPVRERDCVRDSFGNVTCRETRR
jgi:outer membrane lipoprotein SlyB